MRGEFLDLDGQRLYCFAAGTRGAGEPVVFVHGFPTSSHLWSDVIRLMPAGHRLVVLDQLGFGRSDRPLDASLTVAAHGQRLIALLDALCISAACLVGHDLGGLVAQWVAQHAPTRVTALALVNSLADDTAPRLRTRIARSLLPVLRQIPAPLIAGQAYASLVPGFVDRDDGRHALDVFLRPFTAPLGRTALLAHLALQRAGGGVDASRITAPTLVMHGAHDPFVPVAVARQLQQSIRGATLEIVPDARHFTPLDAPDRVARAITTLLASRPQAATP